MFTSFTQFLIVVVILFVAAVLVVDRHEVSRHNRELIKDNLSNKTVQEEALIAALNNWWVNNQNAIPTAEMTAQEKLQNYLHRNTLVPK